MTFEEYSRAMLAASAELDRVKSEALADYKRKIGELTLIYRMGKAAKQEQRTTRQERERIAIFDRRKAKLTERLNDARSALSHSHLLVTNYSHDEETKQRHLARVKRDQELCQQLETELNNLVNPI